MRFSNWLTSIKAPVRRKQRQPRRDGSISRQQAQSELLEQRTLLTVLFVEGQGLGNASSIQVEMADFNGDGFDDAFVTNNRGDRGNRVWFGNGDGTFDDSGQALGSANSWGIAVGDIDGDGDVDAFVGNNGANRVYLNDGDGFFADSGQPVGGGYSVGTGVVDIDGDGDLDLFAANFGQANEVHLNDGSGNFTLNQSLASGSDGSVAFGDIDGDGDVDALTANDSGADFVWINDGSGNLSDSGQRLGGGSSIDVEVADVDGDGDLDAVTADRRSGSNKLWLNDGNGVFSDSGQSLGSARTWGVALGDIDLDGDVDAFFTNGGTRTGPNTVLINDGNGTFTDSGLSLGNNTSIGVVLNDLNGDRRPDAFVANWSGRPDRVWLNDSDVVLNSAPNAVNDSYSTDEDTAFSPAGVAAYVSSVLADSPLGYWRLGETSGMTAIDSSGRGNDGIFTGSYSLGGSGATADGDTSLSLTSSAGYVNAGSPADLDISDDTLTIEAWINPSAVQTAPIAGKSKSGQNDYTLWVVNNRAHFNLYNGSGEVYPFNGTIQMPVGQWSHVVGTYDGTTARIYVNGVLDSQKAFSGNISGNDALNFEIGRRTNGGNQFRGGIDEVALYGDALSADRVLAHFEAASEAGGAGGSVLDNDTDADGDTLTVSALNGDSGNVGQATVLASGATITLNADGSFQYDPTTSATLNALAAGQSTTDSFDYTIDDGNGETDSATVTVTVNGVNDAASISGDNAGAMTEDDAGDSGAMAVSDVDTGEAVFQAQSGTAGDYGDFSIDAAGDWSYTRTANLDSMNAGDILTDSFTVVSADGTASEVVTVTITGVNDAASISGDNAGTQTEDEAGDSGVMTVTDVDDGEGVFQAQSGTAGNYGEFSIDATGNWSYTRTANLQHLAVGESVSESFNVVSLDGTASETVTLTISGENDAPAAANAGDVAVNEGQTVTNHGTWSDVDASDVVTLSASVGSVTRNTDGTWDWSFTSDDGPDEGQPVVITADDGNGGVTTTSFDLTVRNVAPSSVGISGPSTGYVDEVVTVTLTTSDVSSTDQAAGFTYEIDWDGDGSVDETVNGPSGLTVDHVFTSGGSTTVIVNAIDKDGGATTSAASYTIEVIQRVDIDVKPGNAKNKVNAKSQGVIPVAIYTTADFDATTIVGSSVQLAGVDADHFALEDVDGDGDLDMILHFDAQAVISALGVDLNSGESVSVEAELTGETIDNVFIQGFDTIEFFQPGKGKGKK